MILVQEEVRWQGLEEDLQTLMDHRLVAAFGDQEEEEEVSVYNILAREDFIL